MRNPNRVIDKTCLSADSADERIIRHRDLIAHAFRWAHIARYLSQNQRYKDAIVLDHGCGRFQPLPKMLYSNRLIPKHYVGVDANKFEPAEMLVGKKMPVHFWSETDFLALEPEDVGFSIGKIPELPGREDYNFGRNDRSGNSFYLTNQGQLFQLPNIIVSLEVMEHQRPADERQTLIKFLELSSSDCHFFISTPNWDRINCADNHLNEQKADVLGALLEDLGYEIVGFWGTFASQSGYKHLMEQRYPGITKIFNDLSEYYDSTVLSTTFAPLFPLESRNILWHLIKKCGDAAKQSRLFPALEQVEPPWTSHPTWIELSGHSHQHTEACEDRIDGQLVGNTLKCGKEGIWLAKK